MSNGGNRKTDLGGVSGPSPNPTTTATPGKNKSIAYNIRDYVGESFVKRAADDEGFKKPLKDYEGIILFVAHIPIETFKQSFDDSFINSVLKTKSTNSTVTGVVFVNEVLVYIPEISGCLPLPEMVSINAFINKLQKEDPFIHPPGAETRQIPGNPQVTVKALQSHVSKNKKDGAKQKHSDIRKQLRRLDRIPRFYCINKYTGFLSPNKRVEVKFPNENDYTKGILTKVFE